MQMSHKLIHYESSLKDDIHIADLKDCHFLVPSYQRGYKWRPRDVKFLIYDLIEYKGDKPYYMQPLVVAKKNGKFIVVDGQQRLTTFFLIWRRLNYLGYFQDHPFRKLSCFSLEYEKRNASTTYLTINGNTGAFDTPDVRNFKKAEVQIDEIINNLSIEQIKHLEKNFFEKATFLWYVLEDPEDGPKTFERLNGKRIALTDVELCKVLLLSDSCTSSAQRNERAFTWQIIEYRLQDDQFYAFVAKCFSDTHDKSRMDLLLDIVLSKIQDEKSQYLDYPLYNRLKSDLTSKKNVWRKIINTFHRMEQLYDNPLYYNLVGFLTTAQIANIREIIEDVVSADFGEKLVKRVSDWVNQGTALNNLTYKDSKTYNALLLFNILSDLIIKDPQSDKIEDKYGFNHKFRFDLLRKERYDKEHVHATNSKKIQSALEWQQWVINILKYLPKNELKQITRESLEIMKKVENIKVVAKENEDENSRKKRLTDAISKEMNAKKFEEIFNEVASLIHEGTDGDDMQNSIGNMALLNESINRNQAYAASPFSVKRSIIHERLKHGFFVPKGTLIMFDKSFRDTPDEMYHWAKNKYVNGSESDKDSFISFFVDTINRLEV